MKILIIFTLLSLVTFFKTHASADEMFRNYRDGRADFDLTVNYFKTTANFSADGSKTDLLSGTYFQNIDTVIGARYVLFKDFGMSSGINIGSAEATDMVATRRNSTLNKIYVGADYQVFNTGSWNLITDFSYSHALEKIDTAGDSTLNNDGADEVKAILTSTVDFGGFVPFGQIGINYRTEGLSTLLLYSGGAELRFSEVTLGGMVTGYSTAKQDENTTKPFVRDTVTARVDAGSKKFDSVNPTLLDSLVYLKYNFDQDLSFKTFAGYTLLGTNTAVGLHFGAAVNWGFGGETIRRSQPTKNTSGRKQKPRSNLSVDPMDKNFKEDTNDGVNQDYFKTVNPAKDKYIEQINGSPKSLENATDPEPEPEDNQKFEKEYKIKLKKKKKKKSS